MNIKTEKKWVWCEWTKEPMEIEGFFIKRQKRNVKDYDGKMFLAFIENGEYFIEYPEYLVYDNGMKLIQHEMNRVKFMRDQVQNDIDWYSDEIKRLERLQWK